VPTFYHACEFGPPKVKVETSIHDVSLIGISDDGVSSMKIPEGYVVTIYSDKNFAGFSKTFVGGQIHCLSNYQMGGGKTWNNEISSVRVLTAKVDENGAGAKETKLKEKIQKKREEWSIRDEATQKVKQKEHQSAIDNRKVMEKEKFTKDESQAEVKVKSAQKDHQTTKEGFDLAKNQAENLQKNEELAGKANEKGNKQLDEKTNKAAEEAKKFDGTSRMADEKRSKSDKAASAAQDAREKHQKAQDEGRQKSTKKEADIADRLFKERKGEEKAAKTSLSSADENNESSQKSERFAKEAKEKRERKLDELKGDVKKANKKVAGSQREMKKLALAVGEESKSEKTAKSTEVHSKSVEKKAKDEEVAREGTKERSRKIVQAKESTAKAVRTRVEYSVKKAHAVNELNGKKERNVKGEKDKTERDCKESDAKIDKKKELLEKAQVKERRKKLRDIKKLQSVAETAVTHAQKTSDAAQRTVDRQRKRRAMNEEEVGHKAIKKKIAIQKMAANAEIINKGKLAIANRQLESATQVAQEFGEKSRRMKVADKRMMEERQKRSASLESKNKREAKDAAISDEKAAKAESQALQVLDTKERAMDKKKRKLERTEKKIIRVTDEANVLRLENEVSNKKLRVLERSVERVDLKIEKETRNSELKKKESEKRTKQAKEVATKSDTVGLDLKKAAKRKSIQADQFSRRALQLDSAKEKSDKTFVKANEGATKVKMQQEGVDRAEKLSNAAVKEKGDKVSEAYTAKDTASEKAEKEASNEEGDESVEEAMRQKASSAKKRLVTLKQMEVKAKNQQKEVVSKKTRVKKRKSQLDQKADEADKSSEARTKKEKKLKMESESAKELGVKDKTRENGIKAKAAEASQKSDLEARAYRATTEKIIDLRRTKEAEDKRLERAQQEKDELKAKHDAKNEYIQEQDVHAQEGSRKVARAKQDRANARQTKAEKEAKAGKILVLNLHQKLGSLKSTTEKHTKESKVKMGNTATKKLTKVKALKDIENEKAKEKESASILQQGATKKIAEMNLEITQRADALQANKDELDAATSKEKKLMLIEKEKTLTEKLDDTKKAQQAIVDDSVEIRISYERALASEVKAKDDVLSMSKLAEIYSDAEDNIGDLNEEKLKTRKEALAREHGAKHDYKDKQEEKDLAKHNEKTAKYMVRESVSKINTARKAEKGAVATAQKAKHKEYTYQRNIDEKRRKTSMSAIARAIAVRHRAAKDLQEAFMKKAETQANSMLESQESHRKITRKLDDGRELASKLEDKDKILSTQLDTAKKEERASRESFQLRRSPEGKAIGNRLAKVAQQKAAVIKAKYDTVHKSKIEADIKVSALTEKEKLAHEQLEGDAQAKKKTDEKTEKATHDCDATKDATKTMVGKLDALKSEYADMQIRIRAHNERVTKKSEALGVWAKLEDVTRNADQPADDMVDRGAHYKLDPEHTLEKSPEQQKEILAKDVMQKESTSASALAKRILGTDGKVENTKFVSTSDETVDTHPLAAYTATTKKMAGSIFASDEQQSELSQKSSAAEQHLQTLKSNALKPKSSLTGADDTFEKWDKRVGDDWRALDANGIDESLLEESEGNHNFGQDDIEVQNAQEELAEALVQGAKNELKKRKFEEVVQEL